MLIRQLLALRESDSADAELQAWKDAVKKKYPEIAPKIKFKSQDQGKHISAEVDGEDRSYGVYDVAKGTGEVLGEARAVTESAGDMNDIVDQWMDANRVHRFEGRQGLMDIAKFVQALNPDYRSFDDFLEDNSGAMEQLVNWIMEQNNQEWAENLKQDMGN